MVQLLKAPATASTLLIAFLDYAMLEIVAAGHVRLLMPKVQIFDRQKRLIGSLKSSGHIF